MISVSIVIPLYNMEKTIRRTLDNLLSQIKETDDIEIICVNDASTDSTRSILEDYKSSVKIVDLDTRVSTGKVRNAGFEETTKEFVEFLDGDDLLNLDTVRNVISYMIENNLDIGIGEYVKYDMEADKVLSNPRGIYFSTEDKDRCIVKTSDIFHMLYQATNSACWNKVYRKDYLLKNNLKFCDCVYAEDMAFTDSSLTCSDRIGFVRENMITYTIPLTNPNSNDKNSVNTWRDLFTSLDMTFSNILSKKNKLTPKDYNLILKSFLQCCIDNIQYQYRKFEVLNEEFYKVSMDYLEKVSDEIADNISRIKI